MINQRIFATIIDGTLKPYALGLDTFEKGLGVPISDGWMVDIFDSTIEALTWAFFNDKIIKEYATLTGPKIGGINTKASKDVRADWEAINDAIYHYCFNCQFGDNAAQGDRLLVITDKSGEEIKIYNAYCAADLYAALVAWVNRDCDTYSYCLDTSWRKENEKN